MRIVGAALCFALASPVVPLLALRALDAAQMDYSLTQLELVHALEAPLSSLAKSQAQPNLERVALLGDSTMMRYPYSRQVSDRLRRALYRATGDRPRIRVSQLTSEGHGTFDYYFIADVVVAVHPDQVLLAFNLSSFGAATRRQFARPELAGFLAPARLGQAIGLPLHWIGLTTDQLLFYSTIVGSGGYGHWRSLQREQVRLGLARARIETWLGDWAGAHPEEEFELALQRAHLGRTLVPQGGNRYKVDALSDHYAPILDGVDRDHPVLRVLGALVSHFERSGIRTLVFTVPLNVEYIDAMGLYDEAGLAHSLASIETTVREAGGRFLDLHDLLPDRGFRDAPGHFTVDGPIDGPARVAAALVPHVVREVRRSRGSGN